MDDFFITLPRHHFFIPLVLFIKAGDQHLNSTIITFTLEAFKSWKVELLAKDKMEVHMPVNPWNAM
jgi:hypothetical protein